MTRVGHRHSEEDRAAHATLARWYGEMIPQFRSILSPGDVIVIARASEILESLRGDAAIVAVPYSREDRRARGVLVRRFADEEARRPQEGRLPV